ncbi:hypothetical protein PG994_010595 [Apiospora phragmitis]|uniref:DUF221-domain-containing protein n=1 Tax=Apiospora phragmitis TaxID=2905665 RepID=A0ABR1TQD1_9PEZI
MAWPWEMHAALASRQDANDPLAELLKLLNDPFKQNLTINAVYSALATSLGLTLGIALFFSLVRPYHSVVYAPKLKHADEKHAPPPIGKGYFAWITPLWKTNEKDMIQHAGMDATIFLRFTRMLRNIFAALAVLSCAVLLPIDWTENMKQDPPSPLLMRMTPIAVNGSKTWGLVIVGYLSNTIICGFLWWNYRKVLELRRYYFETEEYQHSLHSRTLMLNDIPKKLSSDEGIARIIDEVIPQSSFSRTAMARNVKLLPSLIDQHNRTVRKLEKILQTCPRRGLCAPSKKDPSYGTFPKGQKVDAIEYLTNRIRELEIEVKEVRATVDKRNALPYGFASYDDISEAHCIAHALRHKKPRGTTVVLAPRPNDIIWDNMPLSPSKRGWRRLIVNLWVAFLTFLWIAPNSMIAIFLVNLNNLGSVWPAFATELNANKSFWSIVQGVVNPAITSLVYLVLPIIFRRLSIRAGDRTKTGRERHVVSKLYFFFVFNNLIVFSIFGALWTIVASVVKDTQKTGDAWYAITKAKPLDTLFVSLCNITPFFIAWLLQRSMGAAIDLAQLWTLVWSFFVRRFSNPTPRELIELTAPPAFDYASYYNYFLYYATVALFFGGLQPLVLPAAAIYFAIDCWLKKYLLLYIFITKTESAGMFWRTLFNRLVFATMLGNVITFLVVWIRGDVPRIQAYATVPLPFLMLIFKLYCSRAFDTKIHYYAIRNVHRNTEGGIGKDPLRSDRLASRFGHPALYKSLITPMVHAKAQNILASIYKGRLSDGREADSGDAMSTSGYSDAYVLGDMNKAGKAKHAVPGFEIVHESRMDFEYYKNRPEFASEHGGGEIYGRPADHFRPGTPGSMWNGSEPSSRPGSPGLPSIRAASPGPSAMGRAYSPGPSAMGPSNPYSPQVDIGRSRSPLYSHGNDSGANLVGNAAAMPMSSGMRGPSMERPVTRGPGGAGMLGGGPQGYGGLPQNEEDMSTPAQDPMAYDYFRSTRTRRNPSGAW